MHWIVINLESAKKQGREASRLYRCAQRTAGWSKAETKRQLNWSWSSHPKGEILVGADGFSPLQEKRFAADCQTGIPADENCLRQIHKVHVQA